MAQSYVSAPRLLILAAEEASRTRLCNYVVRSWRDASVQTQSLSLRDSLQRLQRFDAVIVECDFAAEARTQYSTLQAVRAASADPRTPPLILLADNGSETLAVQAIKLGAADYLPKASLSRRQLALAIERALRACSSKASDAAPGSEALELFGYDVRRRLAANGSIAVYVAYSAERGHEVVLKVLHRGSGSLAHDLEFARLADEFKRLFDIDDRAVAKIYDFRVTSQYGYIAMEYFPLGSLANKLTRALPPIEALTLAEEIARALSIIHASGIVHLDLKPGNIMPRDDGTVALIDFGISESAREARGADKPIMGTPYYMSPEQARGEAPDERTDIYAVGVILFQMLTGQKPYVGETMAAILAQHREAPIPLLPEPLGGCQALIERTLAKRHEERVASARELLEMLREARRRASGSDYQSSEEAPQALSA